MQGHIHQERQNLQSTKVSNENYEEKMEKIRKRLKTLQVLQTKVKTLEQVFTEDLNSDNFPQSPSPNIKTNDIAYILIDKK